MKSIEKSMKIKNDDNQWIIKRELMKYSNKYYPYKWNSRITLSLSKIKYIIIIFVIILSFIFLDNLKPSYFYLIYYLLNYYLMSFLLYLNDITYYYYFNPIYAISDYSSYCFLLSYFHHIFSKSYSYPVNYYLSLPTLV